MPRKQIIAIGITIVTVMVFGVILGVNYFEQSFPDGVVEVGSPGAKAEAGQDPNLITAHFPSQKAVRNAMGLRYKFRVNKNVSPSGKILFNGLAFYNPDTNQGWNYFLENNIFAR